MSEVDNNKFRLIIPKPNGQHEIKVYEDSNRAMSMYAEAAVSYGGFDKFKSDGGMLLGPGQEIETNISTTEGGNVSDIAVARIARHEKFLAENGIVMPPPVYAPGTRVIDLGDSNFRTSRNTWKDSADINEALIDVAKTVRGEARLDFITPLRSIHMDNDGVIHGKQFPGGSMPLESRGLEQLIGATPWLFPRGLSLMRLLTPEDRAYVFNKQIARSPDEAIRFRARMNSNTGGYSAYAVVSPTYAPINIDSVCNEIRTALGNVMENMELRGEVIYDAPNVALKVNANLHADRVVDFAAGDVFKIGISAKTSDNGGGGLVVDWGAFRNLCLNLIIISHTSANLLKKRHRGNFDSIGFQIELALQNIEPVFARFAEEWGLLRNTKASDVFGTDSVPDIMAKIGESLDTGFKAEVNADLLMGSWSKEPGDTMADFMNAITRLHDNDLFNDLRRDKVERQAGVLLDTYYKKAMSV